MQKGYSGTDTNGDIDTRLQLKLVKFYLTGTKLGTVTIGIRIGIGVGSVETILHIIIGSISIGIGVAIGVGQCKGSFILERKRSRF